jgi:hypothetical protein
MAAKARFHMTDGDLLIKSCQAGSEGSGGIPMDQDQPGPNFLEDLGQPAQDQPGHLGQALALPHDIQIVSDGDLKKLKDLIEHLPMLGGDGHDGP